MRHLLAPALILTATLILPGCPPKEGANGNTGTDTTHTSSPPLPIEPKFASPEAAVWDQDHLYISNVGQKLEPSTKDGDGYIMRLDPTGSEWLDKEAFMAIKLDAPKGMAIIGKTLYVTDIDRIVAIDLKKISQLWAIDLSRFGTTFLNDIAVQDDSTLLVSGTDINTIFRVNTIDQSFTPLKPKGLNGPNGLYWQSEGGKIVCAEYGSEEKPGRLVQIDATSLRLSQLGTHTGGLDGIVALRNGEYAFTDWDVKGLMAFNPTTGTTRRVLPDSIAGPADLGYNMATDRLCIPHMMENKISIFEGAALK